MHQDPRIDHPRDTHRDPRQAEPAVDVGRRASRYPARRVTDPLVRSPQLGVSDADVVRELVTESR